MNVILCATPTSLQAALAKKLIPVGINLIKVDTLSEVFEAVPDKSRMAFIDDTRFDTKEVLEYVTKIKSDASKQGTRIILLTKVTDNEIIKLFVSTGIDSVFQSSLHYETIVDKFTTFVNKLSEQHSQRKYIRIKPPEEDAATLKFLLVDTNTYITGKITDLSMGGIAASFSSGDMERLKQDQVYPNSQVVLGEKSILADIKIVKKGDNLAAFCFSKIRDTFKDSLAEYVFDKTQKCLTGES